MNIDSLPIPEWVVVTPDIAREMLTTNTHNRNVKSKHHEYAEDMRSGAWRPESCDPLRFSRSGVLLDGQNRLHAVIESETTIPFLVVRGLSDETQSVMDSGVARKFADVLKLQGEEHHISLAAVVRLVWEWERGVSYLAKGRATNSQLLRFLDENPELREYSTNRSRIVGDSCHLPGAIVGCLWWVFDRIDEEDSEHFFSRLADDTGHEKSEPIHELRRTLHNSFNASGGARGQRDRVWMMAVTIKAWNAYRAGNPVGMYKWKPGGKTPERFPEPK